MWIGGGQDTLGYNMSVMPVHEVTGMCMGVVCMRSLCMGVVCMRSLCMGVVCMVTVYGCCMHEVTVYGSLYAWGHCVWMLYAWGHCVRVLYAWGHCVWVLYALVSGSIFKIRYMECNFQHEWHYGISPDANTKVWRQLNLNQCKRKFLGLFQKLSWGGAHFFSDPSTPRTHKESEPPDPQDT